MPERFEVRTEATFEAAHWLKGYPGPCVRMHGHSWTIRACIFTEQIDNIGIAFDLRYLKTMLRVWASRWDHQILNERVPAGINPTAENLSRLLWEYMLPELKQYKGVFLNWVEVEETPGCIIRYRKGEF